MRSRFLLLAASLAAVCVASSQAAPERVVFLTNYVFLGRHAPFFVGVEKGFYREAGLEVSISPSTGSGFVIAALEGGKADYGIAEAAPVVQAIGKGARVKAFGVFMDESTSGLAALSPHPTPESVAGKTVAASLTDSARVVLPILFTMRGLSPDALQWLAVDPSVYLPVLLQGRADLVTASSDSDVPALARIAGRQGKTIHFSSFAEWGYDVFGYFLVARGDRIASRPDQVRAFAAATVRSVRYAIEHPAEAARIVVQRNPALDEELALAQWRASIPAIDSSYVREHGYGIGTPDRLEQSIELVKKAFELEADLSPEDVYAEGFIPR